jgi:hypothetical protein
MYEQQKQPQQRPQYWGDPTAPSPSINPMILGGQQPQMQMPQIDWSQLLAMLEQFRMEQAGQSQGEEEKENPAVEAAESQQGNFDLLKMLSQGSFGGGMR